MTVDSSSGAESPLPAIVLVRPREEGNVGAVARSMANMGLTQLVLVEPAVPLRDTARAWAMHAHDILDRAERHPTLGDALASFDCVVGTASLRERTWPQPVLSPRDLPETLARDAPAARVAIVFGSEVSGLTREELARSSMLVRIPCAPEQPTLNLAQAVLIVAYELFLARGAPGATNPSLTPRATVYQLDALFRELSELLVGVRFARDTTIRRVLRDLRQLLARAYPTEREAMIVRGILRRARHAIAGRKSRRERETPVIK